MDIYQVTTWHEDLIGDLRKGEDLKEQILWTPNPVFSDENEAKRYAETQVEERLDWHLGSEHLDSGLTTSWDAKAKDGTEFNIYIMEILDE